MSEDDAVSGERFDRIGAIGVRVGLPGRRHRPARLVHPWGNGQALALGMPLDKSGDEGVEAGVVRGRRRRGHQGTQHVRRGGAEVVVHAYPDGRAPGLNRVQDLGIDAVTFPTSGTSEDTGDTSFAGMNATFTNVAGDEDLLARIVGCWASLYGTRVMAYRAASHLTEEPTIAVIVQRMIPSERSGIIFTADPSTGDTGRLVIEAVLGQGEAIVSGMVEPDKIGRAHG
mgnify:CR=1 FL=1